MTSPFVFDLFFLFKVFALKIWELRQKYAWVRPFRKAVPPYKITKKLAHMTWSLFEMFSEKKYHPVHHFHTHTIMFFNVVHTQQMITNQGIIWNNFGNFPQLASILNAQHPITWEGGPDQKKVHEEHLFIIVHQSNY